ncbi:MAG: carboxypeptidase-like regulatory domain-containing protein [bacterium]
MENKNRIHISLSFLICSFVIIALAMGCGTSTSTDTSTTTTTVVAASITLSGTLNSRIISSLGVKAMAAVSGYDVVAIDSDSGATYHGTTDSSGGFSISIPGSGSYEVSLITSGSTYFGPIVMSGDSSSSEVVMGIEPSSDTALGTIVVDSSSGIAKPSTEPSTILDTDDTAKASAGVPSGAGSVGKEAVSGVTTRETGADKDKDGIPDLFDADEDGNGIRDGIASTPSTATVSSNTVESVSISSNIWADHGTTNSAENLIAMRIHVYPISGHASEITSVECVGVPSSISNIATIRHASSLGDPADYPTENSLWADDNHQLYLSTTLANNHWIVSIKPKAIMSVGDTFTVRVYYTSGTYQDFFLPIAYVLTDWARITTYNGTTLANTEGQNSTTEARSFATSTLEVVFTKPLDEDGDVLDGLTYSIIVATVEADGNGILPIPTNVNDNEYRATSYPSAFTVGTDTITVSLHDLVTLEAGSYFYITPVAESSDGQRNGAETWFKKE